MKAILFIILLSFTWLSTLGQDITFVTFEYTTAVKMENSIVKVSIHQNLNDSYTLEVISQSLYKNALTPTIDKKILINKDQFRAIVNAVKRIKQDELLKGVYTPSLDGASYAISFGVTGSSVSYAVQNLTYQTDGRMLRDFMNAVELILKTADLDSDTIFS